MLRFAIAALVGLTLLPATASAASSAGAIDTSFGQGGTTIVSLGSLAAAAAVAVQPNGAIVTAGEADINGQYKILSTRMTPSGTLDPTYGVGGIVTIPIGTGSSVESDAGLLIQSDGKIVLAGSGHGGTGGRLAFAVVRLEPNGSLDPTFGSGGISSITIGSASIANAISLNSSGQFVVSGDAVVGGRSVFAATRLNANGSLDTSFGTGGITTLAPTGGAWGMTLQPDGKIVMVGQTTYGSAQAFMAARLLANGAPDPTFGNGGTVTVPVGSGGASFGVALEAGGKLMISGPAKDPGTVVATVRLNPNGSLDPTYGSGGISTYTSGYGVNAMEVDPEGRLLLPGGGQSMVRLNPDGTPDTSFGNGGMAIARVGNGGAANGGAVQADGKLVLAGATYLNGQTVLTVTRLLGGSTDVTAHDARASTTTSGHTTVASASRRTARAHHRTHRRRRRRHARHARRGAHHRHRSLRK